MTVAVSNIGFRREAGAGVNDVMLNNPIAHPAMVFLAEVATPPEIKMDNPPNWNSNRKDSRLSNFPSLAILVEAR